MLPSRNPFNSLSIRINYRRLTSLLATLEMVSAHDMGCRDARLIEVNFAAEFIENKTTDLISPEDLRAPEVVLGLPWDEHVDIWSFGCLVSFSLFQMRCDVS